VWREGTHSPTARAKTSQTLASIPKVELSGNDFVDTAFSTVELLHGIRKLKYHAVTGVTIDRKLLDGRVLRHLHKQGQQVRLVGFRYCVLVLPQA